MRRTLSWGTLLSLLTASPMALALGLAAPRVESTLGAPLQARLPLTDIGELDPALIKARLATAAAFAQAGIPRTSLVESVNATIARESGGLTVVLSTSQAVHEPYLSLLLTLEWPGGQQRQEVNLLLDPPGYAQMPALQSGTARPLRQAQATESPAPAPPMLVSRESTTPGQIRVASGDTLWVLADRVRPEGVSIEGMMLALQRANPEAFPGGNINRLSAGATLDVPDRQTILASGEDADQRVRAQNSQWQAQRAGEADERVAPPGEDATRPEAQAAGGDGPEDGQSRLTLLNDTVLDTPQAAGETDAAPAALPGEARERLAELEAQLDETRQALAQANEQRDQLADQVGTLREDIQGLSAQLGGLLAMRQDAVRAQPEPAQSEPAPPEQAQTAPVSSQRTQAGEPSAESFGQAAWRWLNDRLILLAGAALALLLALWAAVRRRGRRAEEATGSASRYTAMGGVGGGATGRNEPSMAEAPATRQMPAEPVSAVSATPSEPAPASSLAAGSPLDSAPEAETISEAEIYLAYGRYDQARERLVQSLAADPGRHDLRLKLLTACVALGDHDAAEQEAAYLDAHGDEQQRGEAREILARLVPDASAARSPAPLTNAVPDASPQPVATAPEVGVPDVSEANAPGSGDPRPAYARVEPRAEVQEEVQAEAQGEGEALSGLADATVASGVDLDDGRVIDYQPPSLDLEPERREPELGQPVVEFPDDPLGLGESLSEIDDDHATLADAEPARQGESPSATDTSGWIVEEVAFDPLDLDNERSMNHASPAGSAPANAAERLDHARQRLDRGEREAARELLDPLLEEDGTLVADEARVLIERHRL